MMSQMKACHCASLRPTWATLYTLLVEVQNYIILECAFAAEPAGL